MPARLGQRLELNEPGNILNKKGRRAVQKKTFYDPYPSRGGVHVNYVHPCDSIVFEFGIVTSKSKTKGLGLHEKHIKWDSKPPSRIARDL